MPTNKVTSDSGTTAPAADRDVLEFAVRLATQAGELAARLFFAGVPVRRKPDGSEVTEADLAVEDLVREEISRYAPDDAILGEESGASPGGSGRRWVVDPISGTGYFTRRMPLFANLLAYEDEYGPAVGVINLPIQRELVFAGRGLGCWLLSDTEPSGPARRGADRANSVGRATDVTSAARRVRVGDRSTLDGALTLAMNQPNWSEELLLALHRRVALVGAIHHVAVPVVTGRVDAAVATGQGYDDLAPLPVILAEAGGRATDLTGGPLLTGDGTLLIGNPALHARLLELTATTTALRPATHRVAAG